MRRRLATVISHSSFCILYNNAFRIHPIDFSNWVEPDTYSDVSFILATLNFHDRTRTKTSNAFVMSSILYTIPYLQPSLSQLSSFEASLRTLYCFVVEVTSYASSPTLLEVGPFNVLEKRISCHRLS